jgi:uracil-DNA glycosylase
MESFGVRTKPRECSTCVYNTVGTGFCPDAVPKDPVLGVLLESPGSEEVIEQVPLVGRAGKYWLRCFIESLGLKRDQVAIFNTLRCKPPNNNYPIGKMRMLAEEHCRIWDNKQGRNLEVGGIHSYAPNLFVATFHPSAVLRTPPYHRLVVMDMEKAYKYARMGYKPLVLMGETALTLVAPWTEHKGGVKTWRGHVWEGEWPYLSKGSNIRSRFISI